MGLRWIAGVLLLCAWSGVWAQAPSVAEQYLLQAANSEREQRGLRPLRWDAALARAALTHAREMASRRSISHQYPGEEGLAERASRAGAEFSFVAENVAEAQTAVRIHDAWMRSEGHRANLLDARADAIGISVVQRNGQLYAVQDFERTVAAMSLEDQEHAMAQLVEATGRVAVVPLGDDARRTCAMKSGYVGRRQPMFVTRFTSPDLLALPSVLVEEIAKGSYREAAVGACPAGSDGPFHSYSVVVMLFR